MLANYIDAAMEQAVYEIIEEEDIGFLVCVEYKGEHTGSPFCYI